MSFSHVETPYAVVCPLHGQRFLTKAQYDDAMNRADELWKCPDCGSISEWDDDNYEKHMEGA